MVLVGVATPGAQHQVGLDLPAQVVEPLLELRLVGEVALAEALDPDPGDTGTCQEPLGAGRRLVGPFAGGGEDHPVDLETGHGVQELQHRSAAPDLDVVTVSPKKSTRRIWAPSGAARTFNTWSSTRLGGRLLPDLPGGVARSVAFF